MAESHMHLSGLGHAKEVARRLQLRGLIAGGLLFLAGKMAEHYITSFPDWGFDVVVVLLVCLGVYLVWTQPDVRGAILYINEHGPRMLYPALIIMGAVVGGSVGAFGAWRVRRYQQANQDTKSAVGQAMTPAASSSPSPSATSTPTPSPAAPPKPNIKGTKTAEHRRRRRDQLLRDLHNPD